MGTISYAIPQDGQPFATEGPKVDTALSTLLTLVNGNIDRTNVTPGGGIETVTSGLDPAPAAGNLGAEYYATNTNIWSKDNGTNWLPLGLTPGTSAISAAVKPGQILSLSTGGTTGTLPATAALPVGTLVGVRAGSAIGGASPVGVASNGGVSNIAFPGYSAAVAGTFLGSPHAFVVFVWNGSQWRVVAGELDTGWVAMSLAGSVAAYEASPYLPSYRTLGDMTYLKGSLLLNGVFGASASLATFSAGSAPSQTIALPTASVDGSGNTKGQFSAGSGGNLRTVYALSGSFVVPLNGISWSLV